MEQQCEFVELPVAAQHWQQVRRCSSCCNTARLVASECIIVDNVAEGSGGGMCAIQDASFSLQGCFVSRNVASEGGALYLGDNAALGLQATQVENNSAHSLGGVIMLAGGYFAVAELYASVGNNTAPFGGDVIVSPTTISNVNNDTVEGFVSRLGTDAGLLNVTLRTTGV